MYHKGLNSSGAGTYIYFNNAAAGGSGSNTSIFNNTAPTSSVFTVNTDGTSNGSGKSYVAYCFKEKAGYSKFGSYAGNGSTDGTFVYTGFKPAWIMLKNSSANESWTVRDVRRSPNNVMKLDIFPDLNNAEVSSGGTGNYYDFLSNGFKLRGSDARQNSSGAKYIYMAFAEIPLVGSNNVPCLAR